MSKNNLIAIMNHPENGWDCNIQWASTVDIGSRFEVEHIMMGQSSSSMTFVGLPGTFNPIQFDFVDDEGNVVDIFDDPRWNPYIGWMRKR